MARDTDKSSLTRTTPLCVDTCSAIRVRPLLRRAAALITRHEGRAKVALMRLMGKTGRECEKRRGCKGTRLAAETADPGCLA
jgi:hypothetical protein